MKKFKIVMKIKQNLETTENFLENETLELFEEESIEKVCIDWTTFLDGYDSIIESDDGLSCIGVCEGYEYKYEVQEYEEI